MTEQNDWTRAGATEPGGFTGSAPQSSGAVPQGYGAPVPSVPQDGDPYDPLGRAWGWTAATVLLLPILLFWSLPAAGRATAAVSRGDAARAEREAATCRKLGIAAIVVAAVLVVLWILLIAVSVAVGADDATSS